MSGATAFAATTPATYTVKAGDSVFKISHHYHISEKNLISWNKLSHPNLISVNQKLRLTAPRTKAATTAVKKTTTTTKKTTAKTTATPKTYVVKSGDCLSAIAKRYKVTVSQLVAWNHLRSASFIKVGEKLNLKASTAKASSGNASTLPPTSTPSSRSDSLGAAATQTAESQGQAVVDYAKQFIGTSYRYGGESASGFDCSGLVQYAFSHEGISLPRTAAEQATVGQVISKSDLAVGDLVFFDTTGAEFSHVGIYVGNNEFLSATDHGVMDASLSNPYWGPKVTRYTNPWG